ncbi:hypothetical protein DD746_00055 [Helicobacter pylori]|nr:hypothetical protein DD746_00055 [Helicobacter pylori]
MIRVPSEANTEENIIYLLSIIFKSNPNLRVQPPNAPPPPKNEWCKTKLKSGYLKTAEKVKSQQSRIIEHSFLS